jgi:hypothetical protein
MKYSELIEDCEFKSIVDFISKKWNGRFDKMVKIDIVNTKVEIDSFKKALINWN